MGHFPALTRITDSLHMGEVLSSITRKKRSAEIIELAMSKIVRPLSMKSIPAWIEGTHPPNLLGVNLNSSGISRLLSRIGESDFYWRFSKNFMSGIKPDSSLLYNITTIPAYLLLSIFEYGHAKDHADLPQLNFSIVMEKRRFLPVAFETYSWSIPDVVTPGEWLQVSGLKEQNSSWIVAPSPSTASGPCLRIAT